MVRVVVIGGGIAGLSTAWFLGRIAPPDLDLGVRVVDAAGAWGGKLRTERERGFVFEWGPHGFLDDEPDMRTLVEAVLPNRRIESRAAARRRCVVHQGRLVAVPASPPALLGTPLLSLRGRLRLLRETRIPRRDPRGAPDETVADFARRRFGPETVETLADALVTGVFAGDVNRLSLRSAFPKVDQMEMEHGSVIRGARVAARIRRLEQGGGAPVLCSFPTGMAELPEALLTALGPESRVEGQVTGIQRDDEGFAVEVERGQSVLRADVLVLAVPAPVAKQLLGEVDADLASNLGLIPHVGTAVVCLTYDRSQVRGDVGSFGFLCPTRERRAVLGCILASSVFGGHAPDGKVSLRALLGGIRRPELVALDQPELVDIARRELGDLLGVEGEPGHVRVFRHPRAIPQYNVGHSQRLAAIDGRLRYLPSLFLTGAGYRGVSVNDCVRNGRITAQNVVRFLMSGDRQSPGFLDLR